MAYNFRSPGGGETAAHQYPITRSLAILVLAAAVVLFALRHVFGSISIQAGAR